MITTKELCFAVSTFNCKTEYERLVDTIPKDSFIIQGDGVYPEFVKIWLGGETKCLRSNLLSSDGTTEVIHSLDHKGFVFSFTGPQTAKRQAIANKVAELGYRYMIIVDSDEYISDKTDWNLFLSDLENKSRIYIERQLGTIIDVMMDTDADYVKGSNIVEPGLRAYPRIWVLPSRLEYFGDIHYWVRRKKDPPEKHAQRMGGMVRVEGLLLNHDSKLRTDRYLEARAHWAATQLKAEQERQNEYLGFPKNRHEV